MTYPHQRLARFLKLKSLIAKLQDQHEELRQEIITASRARAQEFPQTYDVRVAHSTQKRLESLDAIHKKAPALYETLIQAGCVNEIDSVRVTVKRRE